MIDDEETLNRAKRLSARPQKRGYSDLPPPGDISSSTDPRRRRDLIPGLTVSEALIEAGVREDEALKIQKALWGKADKKSVDELSEKLQELSANVAHFIELHVKTEAAIEHSKHKTEQERDKLRQELENVRKLAETPHKDYREMRDAMLWAKWTNWLILGVLGLLVAGLGWVIKDPQARDFLIKVLS